MPLIMITGIPCSGKTTRSLELKKYFENMLRSSGQNVEIINEYDAIIKEGYDKNIFYAGKYKIKFDIFKKYLNVESKCIFLSIMF